MNRLRNRFDTLMCEEVATANSYLSDGGFINAYRSSEERVLREVCNFLGKLTCDS